MAFSVAELENIANASIDYHLDRGKVFSQVIQKRPLLRELEKRKKFFPGGKELITQRVKGIYDTTIQGYSHNDQVFYGNPANIRTASVPWKELHWGIEVFFTELKIDGISVSDSTTGKDLEMHSRREFTALANIFEDKLEDMAEGSARDMNRMFWQDGTQDPKEVPGIRSILVNVPTAAGTVAGIDQVANSWWRNRASLGIVATTANAADQVLASTMQTEMRQLRRFGNPSHIWFAGSSWLGQLEAELRNKGVYTQSGWAGKGRIDMSVSDPEFAGVLCEYDPTLDDLGLAKFSFMIDMAAIRLMPMEGEDYKRHNPARPHDQYGLYRATTWTGGLAVRQRNTSGVYSIA